MTQEQTLIQETKKVMCQKKLCVKKSYGFQSNIPFLKWNECCSFTSYPELYNRSGRWSRRRWACTEGGVRWVGWPGSLRGGWLWDPKWVGSRMLLWVSRPPA